MVHLARLARFHHEPNRGAQILADQMMMYRGAGEQRRDRDLVDAGPAVRQDDDVDAFADGGLGARAERIERVLHPGGACSAGQVVSRKRDLKWPSPTSEIERIFSRSSLVRIGWRTSSRFWRDTPSVSNRFGRGPMIETRLMTSSSRIGSI